MSVLNCFRLVINMNNARGFPHSIIGLKTYLFKVLSVLIVIY